MFGDIVKSKSGLSKSNVVFVMEWDDEKIPWTNNIQIVLVLIFAVYFPVNLYDYLIGVASPCYPRYNPRRLIFYSIEV